MVRKYAMTEDEFLSGRVDPVDGHLKFTRDNGDTVDMGVALGQSAANADVASFVTTDGPTKTALNFTIAEGVSVAAAPKVERVRALSPMRVIDAPGAHMGFTHAVVAPNGDLVIAYRAAANHTPSKGNIHVARLAPDGTALQVPGALAKSDTRDLRDPCLAVLSDGRIAMSYFVYDYAASTPTAVLDGVRVVFSSDNGATWSGSPVVVPTGHTTWGASAGPIVELDDGTLLLPTYGVSSGGFQSARVSRSTDGGATWASLAFIANGTPVSRHYQEPNIIRAGSGLLALIRCDTTLSHWSSHSSDGGATWSAPVEAFPGNAAPRLTEQSGFLYALYRHEASGVTLVRASPDGGRTWGESLALPGTGTQVVGTYGVAVPWGHDSLRYAYSVQNGPGTRSDVVLVDAIVPEDRPAPPLVGARVTPGASVPVANSAVTSIAMVAEDFDSHSLHSTTANPSRITIPDGLGGYYLVTGTVYFDPNATGQRQARLHKNGTLIPGALQNTFAPSAATPAAVVTPPTTVYLKPGDYIELAAFQDSGAAINVRADNTALTVTRVASA